jgi:hypothetical protein
MASATSFCPECGSENADDAARCGSCGRSLDAMAELEREGQSIRARKLHGVVAATAAGVCVGSVLLLWLSGVAPSLGTDTIMRFDGEGVRAVRLLVARTSLARLFGSVLAFGLAGVIAAALYGGRYLKEVVLGALAGLALQSLVWLAAIVRSGASLGGELAIVGEGFALFGPAPVIFVQLLLMMLFAALLGAYAGFVVRELITGSSTCVHCHRKYALRPTPPTRCPHCDVEQARDGVPWGWVLVFAGVGVLVWALQLVFARELVGIAWTCTTSLGGPDLAPACEAALRNDDLTIFFTERSHERVSFWAVDQWRYLEVGAAWVFTTTLAQGLVVRRGSRAAGAALIPTLWLLGSATTMVALGGIGTTEAGFVFLMRLQVLGLLLWGLAGALGLALATTLRARSGDPLDAIE